MGQKERAVKEFKRNSHCFPDEPGTDAAHPKHKKDKPFVIQIFRKPHFGWGKAKECPTLTKTEGLYPGTTTKQVSYHCNCEETWMPSRHKYSTLAGAESALQQTLAQNLPPIVPVKAKDQRYLSMRILNEDTGVVFSEIRVPERTYWRLFW